ncbi:N-acetylmuramoyl-L-alanine amidase [Vibrio parahaemolyticus]|uniref:N-acetylmuramoyl-L-alanine amidase n=1 Tax=Vibrio parahaemolyticus TaxID=670 RepID=UPI00111EEEB3|nr:N-acetylmuramoyl-L-alanine amidase [Vibrio parahaemolyticus]MBE4286448.1 N-acetylmuramoyl-L-alanine amidase [Vibrio parahaemolyticus]MDF4901764.1 N-acetylmuramoyl-L-alanine amidase [Vibrio parahaemolyticus]TOH18940.1 hypothetical protein CGI90_04275 [Vibrio parahaemolyticus]HCG7330488.1 N-acetylmuramoyl-L-alanine amidase [Vibrio parahaemolyticus]HCG8860059.1 N-acetylmuramoyl-L-alanine amidase [Vibrio parahaemolyticus]
MKTICIVVGHSANKGGAYNNEKKLGEYDYNHVLAGLIAEKIHHQNVRPIIMYRGDSYSGMVKDVNETSADFAIELHCNGVKNKSVQGAETLFCHTSKPSRQLAERLQNAVQGVMKQNDRGLKPIEPNGRGWAFLRYTNMPSVILEPFFISNTESLMLGLERREQLAEAIANALVEHVNKGV